MYQRSWRPRSVYIYTKGEHLRKCIRVITLTTSTSEGNMLREPNNMDTPGSRYSPDFVVMSDRRIEDIKLVSTI